MDVSKISKSTVVVILLVLAWAYFRYQDHERSQLRCSNVGGVYVEAYSGPICVNPRTLLAF